MLVLPYKGTQDEHTLKHIISEINKVLAEDKKHATSLHRDKLGTKFNVRGKTKRASSRFNL